MYHQVISQCTQSLKNLETCLDKAEQHAAAKKFDVGVLMTSRLAPDMQHFIYQVQSACDYVKAAAAWLSGQTPPKHEDNEHTTDELRARIRKTVAFAESVKEAQYAGASERGVDWCFYSLLGSLSRHSQIVSPSADGSRMKVCYRPLSTFARNDMSVGTSRHYADIAHQALMTQLGYHAYLVRKCERSISRTTGNLRFVPQGERGGHFRADAVAENPF